MGSPGPSTALQRLQERAAAAQARSPLPPEPGPGDDTPLSHQQALEAVLLAFPGTTVLQDWEQVDPTTWVDRRTGLRTTDTPDGATPRYAV